MTDKGPRLVSDGGGRMRCSACGQVFDAKTPESLKVKFDIHVRITHMSPRSR